jgi:hypothetical protein|tara:strand:+ start:621 stop:848 length:228 start_codon:yes stop_codon:yes gene_type:complete
MEARGRRRTTVTRVRAPEQIICVDCGGTCHLLPHPETEFQPGDPVAYRCSDCMDRWDIVMPDEDDGRGDMPPEGA